MAHGDGGSANGMKRTTIFLTEVLDENLEVLALKFGDPKGVIIRRALSEFLENNGMQPHLKPIVSITYGKEIPQ